MLDHFVNFISSLRLTVICLCAAAVLVFAGTLAQVHEGLYAAQNRYFRSMLIYWSPPGVSFRVPVFPGGYLVGGVLVTNLLAAYLRRFTFSKATIGLQMTHGGVILLLAGQFATDFLQVESHLRLSEGESRNYSENGRLFELAVIDASPSDRDQVIAIPESVLARATAIHHAQLPFTITVNQFWPNSRLSRLDPHQSGGVPASTQGLGKGISVKAVALAAKMDERNMPSAVITIGAGTENPGTWLISSMLDEKQPVMAGGKTYQLVMRPVRYYKPFFIELKKFSHDKYPGTEIPKNFSSRVRLSNAASQEDREVLIYMNNPLRYGGETYYQSGYDENDPRVTILQVVRNPGWLTPYVSCVLVSLGLLIQFITHLRGFVKERRTA